MPTDTDRDNRLNRRRGARRPDRHQIDRSSAARPSAGGALATWLRGELPRVEDPLVRAWLTGLLRGDAAEQAMPRK